MAPAAIAAVAVFLGTGSSPGLSGAFAQEKTEAAAPGCKCTGVTLRSFVDVAKDPQDIEPQNKVHVRINPIRDKEGRLIVEVFGKAMYPPGTVMVVGLRHRKVPEHFINARVTVRGSSFWHTFGPFTKPLPGGGIVAEAWFMFSAQPEPMKQKLVAEKFFFNTPPCVHDLTNLRWVPYSMGGCDAEDEAEKLEKEKLGEARQGLLDAWKSADETLGKVASGEKTQPDGQKALDSLQGDVDAVRTKFLEWMKTREFLLFPKKLAHLKLLAGYIKDAARAKAAVVGVPVEGMGTKPDQVLLKATADLEKASDEIKGFLDEKQSLDKMWDAYEAQVKKGAPKRAEENTPGKTKVEPGKAEPAKETPSSPPKAPSK